MKTVAETLIKSISLACSILFALNTVCIGAVKVVTPKVDIGKIDDALVDQVVVVQGAIKTITKPSEGSRAPYKVNVADETGSINLVVWPDMWDALNAQHELAAGDTVRLTAIVSRYRDELQLKIATANDVEELGKAGTVPQGTVSTSAPPVIVSTAAPPVNVSTTTPPIISTVPARASTMPLSAITESLRESNITVQAAITNIREPTSERAPYVVTLSQGDATMPLVYWTNMLAAVERKMRVGNTIRANVTVGEYRDKTQLRLRDPQTVEVVSSPGSAPKADQTAQTNAAKVMSPAGHVNIGSITDKMLDQTVTITGKIKSSDKFSKGQRIRVQDSSGEILIIVWDTVGSKLPENALQSGRTMTATGPVKKYRDHLEIQPTSADNLKVAD
jgi:DNA/RNA endonuclease YhcR with UshA esterase domain